MILSSSGEEADLPYELFALAKRLQVMTPEYDKIDTYFYADGYLSVAQVQHLLSETEEIRRRYVVEAREKLGRAKKVHAKDPAVRDAILDGLLKNDAWLMKLDEIRAVCRDAIATTGTLHFSGD